MGELPKVQSRITSAESLSGELRKRSNMCKTWSPELTNGCSRTCAQNHGLYQGYTLKLSGILVYLMYTFNNYVSQKNPLRRYAITAGALLISAAIFARVSWGRVRSEVSNPPVLTFKNHPKTQTSWKPGKSEAKSSILSWKHCSIFLVVAASPLFSGVTSLLAHKI